MSSNRSSGAVGLTYFAAFIMIMTLIVNATYVISRGSRNSCRSIQTSATSAADRHQYAGSTASAPNLSPKATNRAVLADSMMSGS